MRAPQPPAVFAIADAEALAPRSLVAGVGEMLEAGIGWIQLRAKRLADDRLFREAEACCLLAEGTGAALWIDDRADLAAVLPFAGVWLGQHDLPPAAVRRVVGEGVWIGRSTHTAGELAAARSDPQVDVVALGPVYPTRSKEAPDPAVGLEALAAARSASSRQPLVAVGGIDAHRLPAVLAAGADSAAMIGAVCRGEVIDNCRRLLEAARSAREVQ